MSELQECATAEHGTEEGEGNVRGVCSPCVGACGENMKRVTQHKTDPEEFRRFHEALTQKGYEPHYLPIRRQNKNPDVPNGANLYAAEHRLSYEQAHARIEAGKNVAVAAKDGDQLVILDADDTAIMSDAKEPTLTGISSKRYGRHYYYLTDDETSDDPLIDTTKRNYKDPYTGSNSGELKAINAYVLAPGSYVPPAHKKMAKIPPDERENAGRYTVLNACLPASLAYDELPQVLRDRHDEEKEQVIAARCREVEKALEKTKTAEREDGLTSGMWGLSLGQVISIPAKHGGKFANPWHGSTTGKNCVLAGDLLHCFRCGTSHNALTALAIEAGIATCSDGFAFHSHRSPLDFQDGETVFRCWRFAKEKEMIPEDDPIPRSALAHFAVTEGLCKEEEVEDRWKLPVEAYNKAIDAAPVPFGREKLERSTQKEANEQRQEIRAKLSVDDLMQELDKLSLSENKFIRGEQVTEFLTWHMQGYERAAITAFTDEYIVPMLSKLGDTKTYVREIVSAAWKEIKKNKKNNQNKLFSEDCGKITPMQCARQVLSETPVFVMEDSLEYYLYNGRYFQNIGVRKNALPLKEKIRNTYKAMDGQDREIGAEYVGAAMSYIEAYTHTSRHNLNVHPDEIVVKNGILNILSGKLSPFTPEKKITVYLDVEYNPMATCPIFDGFLNDVIVDYEGWTQDQIIATIWEWIGYCLYMGYPYEKAIMLIGEGGNGKGTLLNIITNFLGQDNCSHMSLEQIADQEKHPFRLAGLYGKLANICGDMGNRPIMNTEGYKKACGRDVIDCDVKYGSPFKFVSHAKMMFSVNELPKSADLTQGFLDRWVLVFFMNRFRDSKKRDKHMAEKCSTPEEKSGILNKAIWALSLLMKRNEFTKNDKSSYILEKWNMLSDTVGAFVDMRLEAAENNVITKDALFIEFCDFVAETNATPINKTTFMRRLNKACKNADIPIKDTKDYNHCDADGRPARAYRGVRIAMERIQCNGDTNNTTVAYTRLEQAFLSHLQRGDLSTYSYEDKARVFANQNSSVNQQLINSIIEKHSQHN